MANFSFTQLATPGYLGYNFFRNPAINNNGAVVFEAFRDDLAPPSAIFDNNGGSVPTVVVDVTQGSLFDSVRGAFTVTYNPSISDAGTTAFVGNRLAVAPPIIPGVPNFTLIDSGVYSVGNAGLQTLALSGTPPYNFAFFNSADINSSEETDFAAGFIVDPSVDLGGVYVSTNGNIRTVADTETTFGGIFKSFKPGIDTVINNSPYSEFVYPSINESGTVGFTATLDAGGAGIFTVGKDGTLTTIASTTGELNRFSSAQINNPGQVAFTAEQDAGDRGVFLGNPLGGYTTIADSSGLFATFCSDPSINDLGQVAFVGVLDGGTASCDPTAGLSPTLAIFNGSDPIANRVIGVGDFINGSQTPVVYVNVHEEGLNNSGQIAFEALFADGTYTVFRADPIAVPEASSPMALLAVAALGLLSYGWRRAKRDVPTGRA